MRVILALFAAIVLLFGTWNGPAYSQKGGPTPTPTPTATPTPIPTPVGATYKILYTASDGYVPEAQSLAPLMNAENAQLFVFGGDATFTDAHPDECTRWPTLQWYCTPTILTIPQIQAGWQTMRWPLLQLDRAISYGNHEYGGPIKPDPFVASQFGNQPPYIYRIVVLPGGLQALLVFLNANLSVAEGSPQRIWLEGVLSANPTVDWKIVFVHAPAYSTIKPDLRQRALTSLFDQRGIDLIVAGHVLWYERTKPYRAQAVGYTNCADGICPTDGIGPNYFKGVGQILVQPGCGGMRCLGTATNPLLLPKQIRPFTARYVAIRHHYATLTWSNDGDLLTFRAKDNLGLLDTFTILR